MDMLSELTLWMYHPATEQCCVRVYCHTCPVESPGQLQVLQEQIDHACHCEG